MYLEQLLYAALCFPVFIRSLPDGSAWILDNFPTTLEQAKVDRQSNCADTIL